MGDLLTLADVELGDIIGMASDDWLSRSIRRCTANGPISHVALVISEATNPPAAVVIEALEHVVTNDLSRRLPDLTACYVMRPQVDEDTKIQAVKLSLKYLGRPYNWGDIGLQLLDSIGETKFWTDHFCNEHNPICSMLVSEAYPNLGLDAKSETPNDFYYLTHTDPGRLKLVGRLV